MGSTKPLPHALFQHFPSVILECYLLYEQIFFRINYKFDVIKRFNLTHHNE